VGTAPDRDGGAPQPPAQGGGHDKATEACADKYIAEHKLNEYGDPEGTVYAGGTPLFDEATGTRTERLDYVLSKHPEIQKACAH
jgi:hypothetical protein